MDLLILTGVMVLVGVVIGAAAGLVWKGERPYGLRGDYAAAIVTTVIVGLLDWYVIPMMGFSSTMKWLGVALEPALGALLVLWLMRRAKR